MEAGAPRQPALPETGARVLIVDPQRALHAMLRTVLPRILNQPAIDSAYDSDSGLARALLIDRPHLLWLDPERPGFPAADALQAFATQFGGVPTVVASRHHDRSLVEAAFAAGAVGFIPKTAPLHVIEGALRLVAAGGTYVPPQVLDWEVPRSPGVPKAGARALGLTARQFEVLCCMAQGLTNRGIAQALGMRESTAKQHLRAIFQALGVSSRAEALLVAAERGLPLS